MKNVLLLSIVTVTLIACATAPQPTVVTGPDPATLAAIDRGILLHALESERLRVITARPSAADQPSNVQMIARISEARAAITDDQWRAATHQAGQALWRLEHGEPPPISPGTWQERRERQTFGGPLWP